MNPNQPQPAPPEWATKAAEQIVPAQSVFDVERRRDAVERIAAIIAKHAPVPPSADTAAAKQA